VTHIFLLINSDSLGDDSILLKPNDEIRWRHSIGSFAAVGATWCRTYCNGCSWIDMDQLRL